LCNNTASTTIYVRDDVVGLEEPETIKMSIYPNPGDEVLNIEFENNYTGKVETKLYSIVGQKVKESVTQKTERLFISQMSTSNLKPGLYLVSIKMNGSLFIQKWSKN
jgi:hypothetical protein